MKFVSEIIGSIFEQGIMKKIKGKKSKIPKRKTEIKLLWIKLEIVHYLNKIDIIHGKTKNFDIILNQTRNNIILKKKPLLRAKTNFYNVNSEENEEKSPENSKLFLENKELDNRLILLDLF